MKEIKNEKEINVVKENCATIIGWREGNKKTSLFAWTLSTLHKSAAWSESITILSLVEPSGMNDICDVAMVKLEPVWDVI